MKKHPNGAAERSDLGLQIYNSVGELVFHSRIINGKTVARPLTSYWNAQDSDAGQFVQIDSFRCGTGVSRSMNASASRIVANPCSVRLLPWRERMAAKGNPRRHLRD